MKTFYTTIVVAFSLALFSCSKDKSGNKDDYRKICFKGRYVGTGCSDVVQIISPSFLQKIESSSWYMTTPDNKQIKFNNVIGTKIPAEYKTGDPFYFQISSIDPVGIVTTECSPTEYVCGLINLSKTACDSVVLK